jgi:hypothetical protein
MRCAVEPVALAFRTLVLIAFTLFTPAPARAQEPPAPPPVTSTAPRFEASKEFNEGERAFDRGDFVHAAEAFEAAYRLVPHVDALWNAARAWQRADELARAATLYAEFLRQAPADASDRNVATAELVKLAARLGCIEVHGSAIEELAVDEGVASQRVVYVNPGAHTVRAIVDGRVFQQTREVPAGRVVSFAFEAPPASAPVPPAVPAAGLPTPRAAAASSVPRTPAAGQANGSSSGALASTSTGPPSRGRVPPWMVVGGAALTAAVVIATVASGISTLNARDAFEAQPTPANLSAGESMQERTNLLLGASIGLGVTTAIAAIWLVDWSSTTKDPPVRAGVGFGGVWAGGRF